MAILPITVWGDKILRDVAKKVDKVDDNMITLIRDMFETMHNANGVGLAANQVGSDKSIFVVDLRPIEEYQDTKPLVMINPEIVEVSDEIVIYEEGCLSLPLLSADVERPEWIKIKYLDPNEEEQVFESDDFTARVIQHEFDHLLGKMIPDRIDEREKKKLQNHLKKILNRDLDIPYPVTDK